MKLVFSLVVSMLVPATPHAAADTMGRFMDLVLGDNPAKAFGAEPTFIPVNRPAADEFRSANGTSITPSQIKALKRINEFYAYDYFRHRHFSRFPCEILQSGIHGGSTFNRTWKFNILAGHELAVIQCMDRETSRSFRFLFAVDPGVIEAFIQPDTLENSWAKLPMIQAVMFDVMRDLGFKPAAQLGGGHLHAGMVGNFNSFNHIHRTIVFLEHHSELADGVWSSDQFNANPLRRILARVKNSEQYLEGFHEAYLMRLSSGLFNQEVLLQQTGLAPAFKVSDEHHTLEVRANRPFKTAREMVVKFAILNEAIRRSGTLKDFSYRPHPRKKSLQMVRDYFDLVNQSVSFEDARMTIAPWERRHPEAATCLEQLRY